MYLDNQLESTFCQIDMKNHPNIIVESIYKHPHLSIAEFNSTHSEPLLDKASKEKKILILLGDSNINLNNLCFNSNVQSFIHQSYFSGVQKAWILHHLLIPKLRWPLLIYDLFVILALSYAMY